MSDLVGNPEDQFSHNEAHLFQEEVQNFSGPRTYQFGGGGEMVTVARRENKLWVFFFGVCGGGGRGGLPELSKILDNNIYPK